jgi:hypothetical protein
VTTIGVTGHMNLTPSTVILIREGIRRALVPYPVAELIGVSCVAAGADTIFAEVVLELGGALQVILPSADYRSRKVKPDHANRFDYLVQQAATVRTMSFAVANRDAYQAANEALVVAADRLLAVWDGNTPADKGGTAAVVQYARSRHVPVDILWPRGAERS